MKRPSLWLPVAGIAVQMAALGFVSWAMKSRGPLALPTAITQPEKHGSPPAEPPPPRAFGETEVGWSPTASEPELASTPPPASPSPPPTAWTPADPTAAIAYDLSAPVREAAEPIEYDVSAPLPEALTSELPESAALQFDVPQSPFAGKALAAADDTPAAEPEPELVTAEPSPPYLVELAERATQTKRARAKAGWLFFGFTPDANVRMVDLDGGRYLGKAESARATMVEDDGPRRFDIELLMHADGTMHVRFEGGSHDGETLELEPLVERPLA